MKYVFCCGDDWKSRENLQGVRLENGFVYEAGYKIMQLNAQSKDNTLFIARTGEIVYIPNIYDESELALFFRTFEELLKHDAIARHEGKHTILTQFTAEAVISFFKHYVETCRIVSKQVLKNYLNEATAGSTTQYDKDEEIIIRHERPSLMDAWETHPVTNIAVDRHLDPADVSDLHRESNNVEGDYKHIYSEIRYKNVSGDYRYNKPKLNEDRAQKIYEIIRYI